MSSSASPPNEDVSAAVDALSLLGDGSQSLPHAYWLYSLRDRDGLSAPVSPS